MVITNELNMIDIGGWDQAQTLGTFNELSGEWTYTNSSLQHNDRYYHNVFYKNKHFKGINMIIYTHRIF